MELSHEHVSSSFGPLHASYNTSDEDAKLMSIQQRLNPPSPPQECNSSSSDDDSDTMDCSSSSELSEASKRFFDEYVDTMRAEIGREIQDDLDKEDRTRYFQQQLFLFIKSVVFRWFWDASDATTVSCMDSEDMMKHKLYGQVLMSYGNLFCCNVSKLAYARVIMMRGEILRRIDDDLNHPAIKTLDQILHWREVHIKRKQKRAPLANTFKDVWMLQDHEHQREVDVVYDAALRRPCLTSDGKLMTVKRTDEHVHEGDDPLRLKEIHFFPKPSDRDSNVIDPKAADENHRLHWLVKEVQQEIPEPLDVPAPFYCSMPQYAVQHYQMLNNILHFAEYCINKICHFLAQQTHIVVTPSTTFEQVWCTLAGKKKANASVFAIGVTSSKKSNIITLAAEFRNILRANMTIMTCQGCGEFQYRPLYVETCSKCPEDAPSTLYYCSEMDVCQAQARHKHDQEMHTEQCRSSKKRVHPSSSKPVPKIKPRRKAIVKRKRKTQKQTK